MDAPTSTRRRVLGTAGAAVTLCLAGCSGNVLPTVEASATRTQTPTGDQRRLRGPRDGDDLPSDPVPTDGYPPPFDTVPRRRSVNADAFETLTRGGVEVTLVPVEVAYYWYARREARFADARSREEFEVSHVFGAVSSPAGDGKTLPDDPVLSWPETDRIVTYCDCPHHLSTLRAASLTKRGYQRVYALDGGLGAWRDRDFPLAGSNADFVPPVRVVEGAVPRRDAGRTAWAYHTESNLREATRIGADGRYELDLTFVHVSDRSTVRVETPAYTLTDSLGALTGGRITPDGTLAESTVTATPGPDSHPDLSTR